VDIRHDHVSRLSPAIRHRILLEEEVVDAALERFALSTVEKFVQEVCWRTYWKGWLERRPQIWRQYLRNVRRLNAASSPGLLKRASEVCSGRSGVAVMDRFARELCETGYLHNHARMWWASFWVHVEKLPWQLGADFFFRHLLDADPASNTLGWRWVAGLQTRGKCYLVRRSNLERHCSDELLADATGLDRLEGVEPVVFQNSEANLDPEPLQDLKFDWTALLGRYGLWIHADDLAPEIGELSKARPCALAAFTSHSSCRQPGLSELRQERLERLLSDAVDRADRHFQCAGEVSDTESMAIGLAEWAQRQKLRHVIAFAPFVGSIADAIPAIRQSLDREGCDLLLYRRSWDRDLFPHALRGFFPFWKQARQVLRARKGSEALKRPSQRLGP